MPQDDVYTDRQGVELGTRWTPVASAGLYVPGGTANYPSSVLMNAVPARVAGVPRLVITVPAPKGVLNPLVLAAALRLRPASRGSEAPVPALRFTLTWHRLGVGAALALVALALMWLHA